MHAYTFQTIRFGQAVQEIKESNYELMFVFLSFFVLWDLNHLIHEKSKLLSEESNPDKDTLLTVCRISKATVYLPILE